MIKETQTILIKGSPSVIYTVYRPIKGPQGFVNNPSLNPPNPTLPVQIIRLSTFNRGFSTFGPIFDALWHAIDVKTAGKNVLAKTSGVGWNTQLNLSDNLGNIGYVEATAYVKFPKKVDTRVPQGSISAPYFFTKKMVRQNLFFENPSQGFLTGWNCAMFAKIYDPVAFPNGQQPNRQFWIDKFIRTFGKFDYVDLDLIFFNNLRSAIDGIGNNNNANYFNEFFRCKFFSAIRRQKPVSTDRLTALNLLANFDGGFEPFNLELIIYGPFISDSWILAVTWMLSVVFFVFNQTLSTTTLAPFFPTATNPTRGAVDVVSDRVRFNMLMRLLGTACQCKEGVQFDYLQGRNIDDVIVQGLDYAISILGNPPYNKPRPSSNVTGTFGNIVSTYLNANWSTVYRKSERNCKHGLIQSNGNLLGGQTENPNNIHYNDQTPLWHTVVLRSYSELVKKSCDSD